MDPGFANQATPSCSDAGGREPRTRAPARGRSTILALFALLLLAGCGSTPPLQLDPRPSAGHYSGSSMRVLHEAMPGGVVPPDTDTLELLDAFERAHGIEPDAIVRSAFLAHFSESDRELRGRHRWTLYRYTHGLASPDVYSETLKPVLGVTLILDTPDGTVLWHGVASVGHASLDTPAFTPGQLRDDPDRLRAGWVVAADVVMARLAQKYRAGIRDRREGYAD